MSIALASIERPDGPIAKAAREADKLITACRERGLEFAPGMSPWAVVDLSDSIAYAILVASGYDEELLDMAIDLDPPDGWSLGDLDAELERTRATPDPDGGAS